MKKLILSLAVFFTIHQSIFAADPATCYPYRDADTGLIHHCIGPRLVTGSDLLYHYPEQLPEERDALAECHNALGNRMFMLRAWDCSEMDWAAPGYAILGHASIDCGNDTEDCPGGDPSLQCGLIGVDNPAFVWPEDPCQVGPTPTPSPAPTPTAGPSPTGATPSPTPSDGCWGAGCFDLPPGCSWQRFGNAWYTICGEEEELTDGPFTPASGTAEECGSPPPCTTSGTPTATPAPTSPAPTGTGFSTFSPTATPDAGCGEFHSTGGYLIYIEGEAHCYMTYEDDCGNKKELEYECGGPIPTPPPGGDNPPPTVTGTAPAPTFTAYITPSPFPVDDEAEPGCPWILVDYGYLNDGQTCWYLYENCYGQQHYEEQLCDYEPPDPTPYPSPSPTSPPTPPPSTPTSPPGTSTPLASATATLTITPPSTLTASWTVAPTTTPDPSTGLTPIVTGTPDVLYEAPGLADIDAVEAGLRARAGPLRQLVDVSPFPLDIQFPIPNGRDSAGNPQYTYHTFDPGASFDPSTATPFHNSVRKFIALLFVAAVGLGGFMTALRIFLPGHSA